MSREHFLYLRGTLAATSAEVLSILGAGLASGWKTAGFVAIGWSLAEFVAAIGLANRWSKEGFK